jgi:hypothetical protein
MSLESSKVIGQTVGFYLSVIDSAGNNYTALSPVERSGVTSEGLTGVSLPLTLYDITVPAGLTGGVINVKAAGVPGETVSVTAFAASNNDLYGGKPRVYRTGTPATTITVTGTTSPYTFVMPAYDVTVDGDFRSNTKEITSFVAAGKYGTINNTAGTITLALPYGTDLTSITPTIVTTSEHASPYSPTGAQNFSGGSKTYTVTAEDGSTKTYNVSISAATLSSISISQQPTGGTIFTVQNAANTGLVTTGMQLSGVDSLGNAVGPWTSGWTVDSYDFRTRGQKTITLTYGGKTVNLNTTVQEKIALLGSITASAGTLSPAFNETIATYTVTVGQSITSVILEAAVKSGTYGTIPADSVSQTITLGTGAAGTVTRTITVTSENGAVTKDYTVTVTRNAQANPVTVTFSGLPQDDTVALTGAQSSLDWSDNTSMTVTVPMGTFSGAAYQWYLDGTALSGATGNSITRTARQFTVQNNHRLSVKITTSGGAVYTKTLTFNVVN